MRSLPHAGIKHAWWLTNASVPKMPVTVRTQYLIVPDTCLPNTHMVLFEIDLMSQTIFSLSSVLLQPF